MDLHRKYSFTKFMSNTEFSNCNRPTLLKQVITPISNAQQIWMSQITGDILLKRSHLSQWKGPPSDENNNPHCSVCSWVSKRCLNFEGFYQHTVLNVSKRVKNSVKNEWQIFNQSISLTFIYFCKSRIIASKSFITGEQFC